MGSVHPGINCVEAVIFIGIQGAGKSTFYKTRFFDTHVRINLDMLKTRHREDTLLRACIEMKQPFVVDNTNPTIDMRAKYIQLARAAHFHVAGYYFEPEVRESIARNNLRQDKARIPVGAIIATSRKLQPPSLSEGFDALYSVRIDSAGSFVVSALVGD